MTRSWLCLIGLHDYAWQTVCGRFPSRPACTRCGKEHR